MSELRRFFRCPMLPEQQDSVLLFGESEVPVRLSDMSANGFTAWVSEDSKLKVGDVVQLHAAGSWIPCRIVNLGQGGEGRRLGIERLADRPKGPDGKEEKRGPLRTLRRILSDCSTLIVFVALALGAALGTYGMGAGTSQPTRSETSNGSGATRPQKGVPAFLQPVYDGAAQLVWRIRYGAGAAVAAVVDVFRGLTGPSRPAPEKKQG